MGKQRFSKNTLMYEGSVKRIFTSDVSSESLVFEFTDDYSVFDWGKMPDTIPLKGEVLAKLASVFFEKLQNAEEWKEFFLSPDGVQMREALAVKVPSATVSALTEKLQTRGLTTHYQDFQGGRELAVQKINVHRPQKQSAFGMQYYKYPAQLEAPFLIPLEVVFRFEVAAGSSFIKRNYDRVFKVGDIFSPPLIETFTKLEPQDRALSIAEAAAMSGLTANQFEELFLKTSCVAGILKYWFSKAGIRLVDGKLEWGLDETGEVILVDAIGPDEMRLEKDGLKLSKELLRDFYRKTAWYSALEQAKLKAETTGDSNWKAQVPNPPPLPEKLKTLTSAMYQALVNEMTGKKEFPCADLAEITRELKSLINAEAL